MLLYQSLFKHEQQEQKLWKKNVKKGNTFKARSRSEPKGLLWHKTVHIQKKKESKQQLEPLFRLNDTNPTRFLTPNDPRLTFDPRT